MKKDILKYVFLLIKKEKSMRYLLLFSTAILILRVISENWIAPNGGETAFAILVDILIGLITSIFFYAIFVFRNEQIKTEITIKLLSNMIEVFNSIENMYKENNENLFEKQYFIDSNGARGVDKIEQIEYFNIERFLEFDHLFQEMHFYIDESIKYGYVNNDLLDLVIELKMDKFNAMIRDYIIALKTEKKKLGEYYAKGLNYSHIGDVFLYKPYLRMLIESGKKGTIFDTKILYEQYHIFSKKVENLEKLIKSNGI